MRLILTAFVLFLSGCSQMIWTTGNHPPAARDRVQILPSLPPRYERLGTVAHLSLDDASWQDGADATAIIQDLLAESASMGANALVLDDDTTMADTSVTMTYQGKAYKLPVIAKTKTILGQAIFVKD